MPNSLRFVIAGLVALSAGALAVTSLVIPPDPRISLALTTDMSVNVVLGTTFWTLLTLVASGLPVQLPGGMLVTVSTAPIVAATILGGPAVGGWVALIGSTEVRELRGKVPWYGTLANHAGIVLPAVVCGLAIHALAPVLPGGFGGLVSAIVGAVAYFLINLVVVSFIVSAKTGTQFENVVAGDIGGFGPSLLALGPLGWLMSRIFEIDGGWWSTLIFALPLYTTRFSYHQFVRIREMFTQTIGALAAAVDARDPYTANHSLRVKDISVDIGRQMRVSATELEALEWGGLLHDVGKIGVSDAVLLKTDKLTKDERQMMNAHPVKGAEIIGKVERLAPELPVIRHHHEWYNGSGYPDRLMGDEIPKLARILHVADAFEAMTSDRPYRKGLPQDVAVSELRKFSGIQFDPDVVEAFMQTHWAEGAADPARPAAGPTISLLGDHAKRHNDPAPGSPAADLV